jgi:DNA-binding transcriptional MerR regulator
MYTAQRFATIAGVTIKVLRHYERQGLLAPKRNSSGHRRYTFADLQRLERVLALRAMGLPLNQIGGVLEADPPRRATLLDAQRRLLEERRARITRAIDAIDTIASGGEHGFEIALGQLSWHRWESRRDVHAVPRPPDRVHESRRTLFHDIAAALHCGADADVLRRLVTRWDRQLQQDAGGHAETLDALRRAWAARDRWPDGMRRYVASLYETDSETFERVACAIERARGNPSQNGLASI